MYQTSQIPYNCFTALQRDKILLKVFFMSGSALKKTENIDCAKIIKAVNGNN